MGHRYDHSPYRYGHPGCRIPVGPCYAEGGGEGNLPFREEADVFKLLRLDYVKPEDRNV